MVIYDYSPTKVELQSHIQFFSGGRCNVTLGGGRSIRLSYGDRDMHQQHAHLLCHEWGGLSSRGLLRFARSKGEILPGKTA